MDDMSVGLPEEPPEADPEFAFEPPEILSLPSASWLARLPRSRHPRRILSVVATLAAVLVVALFASLLYAARLRTGGTSSGPTFTQTTLSGVSMVSPDEGWMVGSIVTFSIQPTPTATATPAGSSSNAPLTGYHVISESALLYHYLHGAWLRVPVRLPTGAQLDAISMDSPSDGWAVGNGGSSVLLLHYDGATWRQVPVPVPGRMTEVRMVAPNDGWALGLSKDASRSTYFVLHYDGASWTEQSLPASLTADAQAGLAVHNLVALPTGDAWLIAMSFPSGASIVINPGNGSISGTTSTSGSLTSQQNLPGSLILHSAGGAWTVQATLPGIVLTSFDMVAPDEGWAVGSDLGSSPTKTSSSADINTPVFLHYTGDTWTRAPSKVLGDDTHQLSLTALDFLAPNDGWAVGTSKTFQSSATIVNGQPQPSPAPLPAPLASMLLAHYDGTTWVPISGPALPSDTFAFVSAASFGAPGDGWMVGALLSVPDYAAYHGSPPIAQSEPLLLHYAQGAWSTVDLHV